MKVIVKFCLVFILFLVGCSVEANKHGRLKVDKILNFGSMNKGARKTVKLKMENLSTDVLEVIIGASCSCTTIYKNKIKIKGHTKIQVPLSLYADSTKNYISEILTIKLNNPKEFRTINIKANVK